jgi:hypothetical protein
MDTTGGHQPGHQWFVRHPSGEPAAIGSVPRRASNEGEPAARGSRHPDIDRTTPLLNGRDTTLQALTNHSLPFFTSGAGVLRARTFLS